MTPEKKKKNVKKAKHAVTSFCQDFLVSIALVVVIFLVITYIIYLNNPAFINYLENTILQTPYAGTTENVSSNDSLSILIDEEIRNSPYYQQILDSGYSFVIVDSIDFVPPESPSADAVGLIDYQNKIIYITPTLGYKNVVNHEIGHWIDDRLGTISNSAEFEDIFYAEKDAFNGFNSSDSINPFTLNTTSANQQAVESPEEMFAEAYALLVAGNADFQKKAPRTYEFVKEATSQ